MQDTFVRNSCYLRGMQESEEGAQQSISEITALISGQYSVVQPR